MNLNACNVCGLTKEWKKDVLISCSGSQGYFCPVIVHQLCYGVKKLSNGEKWQCSKCKSVESQLEISCQLCPNKDGAFKPTNKEKFVHVVCCLYTPDAEFGSSTTMEPVNLDKLLLKSWKRQCYICKEAGKMIDSKMGSCIKCHDEQCSKFLHVTCGQEKGLLIEEVFGKKHNLLFYLYCEEHQKSIKNTSKITKMPPFKPTSTKFFDIELNEDQNEERKSSKRKAKQRTQLMKSLNDSPKESQAKKSKKEQEEMIVEITDAEFNQFKKILFEEFNKNRAEKLSIDDIMKAISSSLTINQSKLCFAKLQDQNHIMVSDNMVFLI